MPPRSIIDQIKANLKSSKPNDVEFEKLWEQYDEQHKKQYISTCIMLACEKGRVNELLILLSNHIVNQSIKALQMGPHIRPALASAFYYAQQPCIDALSKKHPKLLETLTLTERLESTEQGLNEYEQKTLSFYRESEGFKIKRRDYEKLLQTLHVISHEMPVDEAMPVAIPSPTINFTELLEHFNRERLTEAEQNIATLERRDADLITEMHAINQLASAFLATWKLDQFVIKNNGKVKDIYPSRDLVLDHKPSAKREKLHLFERLFQFINPDLFLNLSENEHLDPIKLQQWYFEQVNKEKRHFVHDPSDDSDSADERGELSATKRQRYAEMKAQHTDAFWKTTRKEKLLANDKKNVTQRKSSFINKKKSRAKIPDLSPDCSKQRFVATFRGNNYLEDRWSPDLKREHYHLEEVGRTHYSEAAMMAAGNFYKDPNFFKNATPSTMEEAAQHIQRAHREVAAIGPCLGLTRNPNGKDVFLFNSFGDYLQHHYSNGIHDHLTQLVGMLKMNDSWLSQMHPNAYNYAISTGDRPDHSLRYALGLKPYYQHPFVPRYNQDGSIQQVHAGKLYIFLFELEKMQDPLFVNRVNYMLQNGTCPVMRDTSNEVETTFFGKIDSEHLIYEFQLRFPNFKKDYKCIYKEKYGMDKDLYDEFKSLLISAPFEYTPDGRSEKRDAVVDLLKEWLCAYYEVMAVKIAEEYAIKKGGVLTYYNQKNEPSSEPTQRPLNKGNKHIEDRRKLHVLEETRRYIATSWKDKRIASDSIELIDMNLEEKVKELLQSREKLSAIAKKISWTQLGLTEAEEFSIDEQCKKPDAKRDDLLNTFYSDLVKRILTENLPSFASRAMPSSQGFGIFSWRPPETAKFKNSTLLANDYTQKPKSG